MKRRHNTVLRILRVWVLKHQQEVATGIHTDQSTVSRMEQGEIAVTPEMECLYVSACGGSLVIKNLIDQLQSLLDRLPQNGNRLKPA